MSEISSIVCPTHRFLGCKVRSQLGDGANDSDLCFVDGLRARHEQDSRLQKLLVPYESLQFVGDLLKIVTEVSSVAWTMLTSYRGSATYP